MPKIVELPGNRTVEFPDDFTEDRMNVEILHAFPDLAKGGVLEPGIPQPDEMMRPGIVARPPVFAPAPIEESQREEAMAASEAEQARRAAEFTRTLPGPELQNVSAVPIDLYKTDRWQAPDFSNDKTIRGGLAQAAGGLAEWAVNEPEQVAATFFPPTAVALGLYYGPQLAKQAVEDLWAYAVNNDEQAGGRFLGLALLVATPAAARGMLRKAKAAAAETQAAESYSRWLDKRAIENLAPGAETKPVEIPKPVISMEPASGRNVLLPQARELVSNEAEDVFGLAKLSEADNAEIAAASETLKTEAPLTAAELAKEVPEPTPEPPAPVTEPAATTKPSAPTEEILYPQDTLAFRGGDPVKASEVTMVKRTRNNAGQIVWAVFYERNGVKYVGYSENPAWANHPNYGGDAYGFKETPEPTPTPEPPPTAPEAKAPPAEGPAPEFPDLPKELARFDKGPSGYREDVAFQRERDQGWEKYYDQTSEQRTAAFSQVVNDLSKGVGQQRAFAQGWMDAMDQARKIRAEPTPPAKVEAPVTPSQLSPTDKGITPQEKAFRSTAEGQKAMASRASRIATLNQMNEAIRKIDPKEAYDRALLEQTPDSQIDSMMESLRQDYNRLVAKPEAKPAAETGKAMGAPATRTTPAPGTPEREAWNKERSDIIDRAQAAYEKAHDLREQRQKTSMGTKKHETLGKQIDKADDAYSALKGASDKARAEWQQAGLEDVAGENIPIASEYAVSELEARKLAESGQENAARKVRNDAWDKMKSQVEKKLKESGLTDEEARDEAMTISSMVSSYPLAESRRLNERFGNIAKRVQSQRGVPELREEFDAIESPVSGATRDRFRARMFDRDVTTEQARKVLSEYKDWVAEQQKEAANREKAKSEKEAADIQAELLQAREWEAAGTLHWIAYKDRWAPVEGKSVKLPGVTGIDAFVRKTGDHWTVTEERSGLALGTGKLRADAIKTAAERVAKSDRKLIESKISEIEKQLGPRPEIPKAQPKPPETPPTGPGVPTPSEQAEIRSELDDTLGGRPGIPLKPLPPGAGNIPVKGLHEIIQDLAKGLQLPIRFGRLTTTKFAGYFKPVADLIGSRRANDITTISHEVGHKLDKHLKLSNDRNIAGELDVLGDPATPGSGSSWTKSKSHAYKLGEGVGEFVRYWLTDPPEAMAKAPKTYAAFEIAMNANPDFGDVMRTAQADIQIWRAAPSQSRLRSHISIGDNPNKTPYRLRQLTRDLVDDLHILRVAVDDAQRWLGSKLAPMKNPYVLARLLRGAYGRADVFVRHGTVDFKTKAVTLGKSLQDALKPIAGKVDEFRDYIVAKRAQELHSQGRNTGLLDQDIQATVQHYANDTAFQKAFDDIKEWQDSLLQYARDAGLITDEGLKAMRKMNQDYVPFHRLFEIGAGEISSLESPGLGRGLNLGKPSSLRGLHGSPRPIVDPLETMIKNAYVLTTAAEKQAIHLALADLASSPGMGKWVEKIATPKEMVKVGIEKIRKQLVDAGADLTGVPDDLLLSFFQNSRQAPFGENIIKIVRDGKPEFYRLDRELFDTFHALDLDDAGQLTRLLAAPAQLLRSGVILAPDFALANAFRDAFSSAIVGKYTVFPFEATIRGLAAMLRRPQLVEEWKASGGANVVEAHYFDRAKMQEFMRKSITSDLTPMEKAVLVAKGPLTFLRWLTGTAEEATRIGEYEVAYKALRKGGISEGDARTMAAFESRDRQDFAKGGAKTKLLRLWTPFWNAGLQANVKLAQAFRERPFQTTVKGLAFITTAKVIEQALNWDDDDYWDRPQWERDTFFMIPVGKDQAGKTRFLKLPTPFEPGIIFGTLPGRVFQYLRQKDRRAINGFMQAVAQQTIPNPIPQPVQVIVEDFMTGSKGWDIFRGRQIVPEKLADYPVEEQWTEQTSLTARKVGKLIGLSPMKVDHIIASTSGGLGRQLTHNVSDRLIQLTTGQKPTATSQMPGGRFITVPGGIVSQSVEDFYTYFQKVTAEENRFKITGKGKDWAGLATDFRSAAQQMSQLRMASRSTTDPLEKQKYAIQIAEIAKVYAVEARKMGVK